AFGLSKILGIPQSEATSYIKTFFQTYPGIQTFFYRVLTDCQRLGYVTTILGRKRRIEGVRGPRGGQQLNMPERTAINTVIQGSAADLMKWTMVRVYDRFYRREKIAPQKTQLLLQIHDELLFETSHKFLPELTQKVKEEMELGQPLSVPLKVDAEQGINWGVLK
ncbi:MAG: DNA polymerase I, partial [Thermoguttaceae bacterium]|nr:DNA polymerase I [Thermoguttaceae bacterium]